MERKPVFVISYSLFVFLVEIFLDLVVFTWFFTISALMLKPWAC